METMSSHLPKLDEEKLKFVIELKENRKMLDDGNEEEFIASQTSVAADIIDLIRKEETVLYPTSLAMISEEEFEDMKSGDREIGFTFGKLETTNEAKKSVSQENTNISEHIVEEIIEKFRSDEQDFAEFWINKPGLFISLILLSKMKMVNLKDLIKVYPKLKEDMVKISDNFKLLQTSLSAVILPTVTLKKASERGGVELNTLIEKIKEIIKTY
ncbi:hypothetical protein HMPREF1539_00165 [Fusobacterium nucleatum CTI-2]|nr:hypothetical protein HMPREF1539_00165 [Fusobacterium nucleatum CTI-2]